ncbi:MAG: iron transporter [Sphingomonas sanxanigenens]|uniref:Iron transporter n=1 Tax=Sphingomonas sanxanigenens TaxID=397260 RepID=A0A2W5A4G6_9SPHN|nr:MAG: iron transporter [Sphingomonas sanxanigenens]
MEKQSDSGSPLARWRLRDWRNPLRRLGPGLITGVADDDPSGIATYSQAGAQFGFNMLWTMALSYPLMSAVQLMCGNLGRVTGKGLSANIKAVFSPRLLRALVALLLIANTLNIAADVAAMGEAAELVTGVGRHWMTLFFVALTLVLQIFVPYHRYVNILKWLTLSLLAYVAVLFTVHVPWGEVLARTVWPHLTFDGDTATMIVGVFGTTISPYLFFWQASEEVEDLRGGPGLIDAPEAAPTELGRISWDTWSGMLYSNIAACFIILATAVTLHAQGLTTINTAAEAASALRPLAGEAAFALFAIGILGVGLVGVPVLAGSAAYAMAEAMGWHTGLERKVNEAKGFYGVIAVSVLAALFIQFSPMNPMRALFWSAVINGVVAVPLMAVLILLVSRRSVMGDFVASKPIRMLGWAATGLMGGAALLMIGSMFF